jgi:A/G-specific adenine glycosylase
MTCYFVQSALNTVICGVMEIESRHKKYFTNALMRWHNNDNDRDLPWKNEKDPYRIWLSEVILQQTRAQQGLPYYLAFIDKYPTLQDIATANDQEAFRLWQGLGYYNRCKNMLATARIVAGEHQGLFPESYDGLLALKGIGPYTAAAIASFAYELPHAVVDGNVYRVLSRHFGIETPFDTTAGKKEFAALAQELLEPNASSDYNQAIMDLGATVCTPKSPNCPNCPLYKNCFARKNELQQTLPIKSKKLSIKKRFFTYLLLIYNDQLWIQRRGAKDIWENLHEPLLIETDAPLTAKNLLKHSQFIELDLKVKSVTYIDKSTQRLTHQLIDASFYRAELTERPSKMTASGAWLNFEELEKKPFPKTVVSFFKNNLYF